MPLPFILAGAAVAAAGFGVKKGYDGYQDKAEANEILETYKKKYEVEKSRFDLQNDSTNQSLTQLGSLQLDIGNDFKEFRKIAERLLDKLNQSGSKNLKIDFPQHKLDEIDGLALSTTEYVGKVAGAGVAGAAAAYAVYGGVMALAAASTGTPIAALSGAAAYNATMAAIGGGSLAAGGFGMAGGALVLGGVVAAPIMMVAGWAFASHAEEALSDARKAKREINSSIGKMNKGREQLKTTKTYIDRIYSKTSRLHEDFKKYFDNLKAFDQLVTSKGDISRFGDDIIRSIHNGYQVAAILTNIITTPLFKPKLDKNGDVVINSDNIVEIEMDENGMQVLNKSLINKVLVETGVSNS